jgi:hypothetical protein
MGEAGLRRLSLNLFFLNTYTIFYRVSFVTLDIPEESLKRLTLEISVDGLKRLTLDISVDG